MKIWQKIVLCVILALLAFTYRSAIIRIIRNTLMKTVHNINSNPDTG